MKRTVVALAFSCFSIFSYGQKHARFVDSIRAAYSIPELGYAVVSANEVLEIQVSGVTKVNTNRKASLTDRFRIGSNTKTVTAFIAAQLVKEGKLSWDSKFFEKCPELIQESHKGYRDVTLLEMLSFRSHFISWTYTNETPASGAFKGNDFEQRYQFMLWALRQKPADWKGGFGFSNPGYVVATLMLEKATGKHYQQMVADLGKQLNIDFRFGAPNAKDTLQPWGHDENLKPEAPTKNDRLNWLEPAGNINVTLPDYAKFVQLQLQGLHGKSALLSKKEFEFMHFGLPEFAVGWFWKEEKGHKISYHTGNPGTFLSQVYIDKDNDRAYILFANVQSSKAEKAFELILSKLGEDIN